MSPLGSPGGGAGTGMGLGVMIMAISIVGLMLRRPAGPIRKLLAVGAISPETARRSHAVGIPREDVLRPYVRLGVAKRLEDGRWYVDPRRDRMVRVGLCAVLVLLMLGLGVVMWFTWEAFGGGGSPQ